MKTVTLALAVNLLILGQFSYAACPDLNGTWTCLEKSSGNTETKYISYRLDPKTGLAIYSFPDDEKGNTSDQPAEVTADGNTIQYSTQLNSQDERQSTTGKATFSCNDKNELTLDFALETVDEVSVEEINQYLGIPAQTPAKLYTNLSLGLDAKGKKLLTIENRLDGFKQSVTSVTECTQK